MRIDELDPNHKKFKEVILDHELTEEQLDEILPVVGAVAGGIARGAMAVGGLAARGASALARGVGAVGRGIGNAARNIGGAVNQATSQVGNKIKTSAQNRIKNYAQNKIQNFGQDTTNNMTGQQSQGSQGTIGTDQSQNQQATLQRGQDVAIPQVDPKNPNKVKMTPMKVKNVTGREVELVAKTPKKPGQPSNIKFDKKDLAF